MQPAARRMSSWVSSSTWGYELLNVRMEETIQELENQWRWYMVRTALHSAYCSCEVQGEAHTKSQNQILEQGQCNFKDLTAGKMP